jgi:hypothetical protein
MTKHLHITAPLLAPQLSIIHIKSHRKYMKHYFSLNTFVSTAGDKIVSYTSNSSFIQNEING